MEEELEILKTYLVSKGIESKVEKVLPKLNYNCLEWKDSNGWMNRVYNGSLLILNNQVRAYQLKILKDEQEDNYEFYLVIVEDSKPNFKWKLIQEDRDEKRFNCLYLGKHENSIIHIHKHALHTSILSYKNAITRFHCVSELINRKGNIVAIERVQKINKDKPVELIKLPDLTIMEPISYEEANQMKISPTGNFPIGYLNDK